MSGKVFVSSTGLDLAAYREVALKVCRELELVAVAMEDFEAMGVGATAGSLAKLAKADVYVGIFAHRYGFIEPGQEKSVTELEFDAAGERGLERLCFLVDPDHPWPPSQVDHENYGRLKAFKARIEESLIRARFTTPEDFRYKLNNALRSWQGRHEDSDAPTSVASWRSDPRVAGYLGAVWDELSPLQSRGVAASSAGGDLPLAEVYTALDMTAEFRVGEKDIRQQDVDESLEILHVAAVIHALGGQADDGYQKQLRTRLEREAKAAQQKRGPRLGPDEPYSRRLSAIEAAAMFPRLVILGPAGSGKSTFVRYLLLCLAGEPLGRNEANLQRLNAPPPGREAVDGPPPWPHGTPLPVFVELLRLVRSAAFLPANERGKAQQLLDYLEELHPKWSALLQQAFSATDGALLVLDGLDETPTASRDRLQQLIGSFVERFPQCRLVVTSRPYAYVAGSPSRRDGVGFGAATLAPLDEAKTAAFIGGWYRELARRKLIAADLAERCSTALKTEVTSKRYLRELAERPLTLTILADVHASGGGHFRGGRAALYERSVELLLDRWNETRDILGERRTVADHLGMTVAQVRGALEGLAYKVHKERGASESSGPAEIGDEELWRALEGARPATDRSRVDTREVMHYLDERSGILLGESNALFRFPHRSYQEYLAACHLQRTTFPYLLQNEVKADPALWREVFLFAAAKVSETPYAVWALLEGLAEPPPAKRPADSDPRYLWAYFAALAVAESSLWQKVEKQDAEKLERIRRWLEALLPAGALPPVERAEAGRILGVLGDRRPGVGLRKDDLPDISWVEIPAGEAVLGSTEADDNNPLRRVEVGRFWMSRYPVTNAQFDAFVQDGGYTDRWRKCWSTEGWWEKEIDESTGPADRLRAELLLPNHPRVNVTWYEAEAFCHWLSARTGHTIRLATEEEWEKAARGSEGRIYPWGNEFDASLCNMVDTGIGMTSAVGCFPGGASPYGVEDLSGNVDEWCSTSAERGSDRIMRGGNCAATAQGCRAVDRIWIDPSSYLEICGFRLVKTSPYPGWRIVSRR